MMPFRIQGVRYVEFTCMCCSVRAVLQRDRYARLCRICMGTLKVIEEKDVRPDIRNRGSLRGT